MPTKKPIIAVIFENEAERRHFKAQAKKNKRSNSNEFRALAGLPELAHGGKREKSGRKKTGK